VWIGALKFTDYEVENAESLVTASPLTSRLHKKLGAQKLARLVGVTQITLGLSDRGQASRAAGLGGWQLGGRRDDAQYAQPLVHNIPGRSSSDLAPVRRRCLLRSRNVTDR
jgi:hypothetical protein